MSDALSRQAVLPSGKGGRGCYAHEIVKSNVRTDNACLLRMSEQSASFFACGLATGRTDLEHDAKRGCKASIGIAVHYQLFKVDAYRAPRTGLGFPCMTRRSKRQEPLVE